MPKWNLSVADETDHLVRGFLARTGMKKGDLSAFVEGAVQAEVLRRSARELQEKDPNLTIEEATALAENLASAQRQLELPGRVASTENVTRCLIENRTGTNPSVLGGAARSLPQAG